MPPRKRNSSGYRTTQLRARVINEETHCRLCGDPVDKRIKNPDPMAPVVDHLTPIARGGDEYDRANLGLMHRHCNRTKSTLTLAEALRKGQPAPRVPVESSPGW